MTLEPGPLGRARPRALTEFLAQLPGTTKRFWVLVVLTGLAAGLSAVLLVEGMKWVQRVAWGEGATFLDAAAAVSPLRRALLPLLAGALVVFVSIVSSQPMRGHGTAGIIEAIWTRSGRMPFFRTLLRGMVSIVAVALGAPLGREGALLQAGAATGSSLAQRLKLPPDQARLLVACGASAGIAAAYNVPIGAALFGLEVLLGSFALELFGPIVLACVVSTLVSRILIADHPSYLIPMYRLGAPKEILVSLAFAPLLGFASALFVKGINRSGELLEKVPASLARFLPLAALGLVGLAAVPFPQVLGNGYDSVNAALLGQLPLTLLLLLPLVKLCATSVSSAAGVPGGLFTPSLFFGGLLGGAIGQLAQTVWPGVAPSGAYALFGMAAVLAGTTHAAVSAVLIIFELTGNYQMILPLMLCSVLSAAVSRSLEPESLYSAVLRRRNVKLPSSMPPWLGAPRVRSLFSPELHTIAPRSPFRLVVTRLLDLPPGASLYVVDEDGKFFGRIPLSAVKGLLSDSSLLDQTLAIDLAETTEPVGVDTEIADLATRFSYTHLERLPVVDGRGVLLGTISKADVLRNGRF